MTVTTPLALSFLAPWWLLALAVIPIALAAYVAVQGRRRQYAVRFTNLATLAASVPRVPGWRRHVPPAILALALALLAVALARPQATVSVPREEASIMLVTDTSGSMQAGDVAPNRLDAARGAADQFLKEVPDKIRVGAVAFSSTAALLQRPTTDRQAVRDALDTLVPGGGTATGDGITSALRGLEAPRGQKRPPSAIVLLSDGAVTSGTDPNEAAAEAGRLKTPIYTIALGTADGTIETPAGGSLPVPPDPEALRAISDASGGRFFDAPDADQLSAVYDDLGSRLGRVDEQREVTQWFAGAGLLLVLAGAALGLAWTGRLP